MKTALSRLCGVVWIRSVATAQAQLGFSNLILVLFDDMGVADGGILSASGVLQLKAEAGVASI